MKANNTFQDRLYLIYIFLIPLGRIFQRPENFGSTVMMISASTIVMLFGVLLLAFNRDWRIPKQLMPFWYIYMFMSLYSLILAPIIYHFHPTYLGRNVLFLPFSEIVLYLIVLLSITYNFHFLSKELNLPRLFKPFDWSIYAIILIGVLQLGAMLLGGGFASIYNSLSSVLALNPLRGLLTMDRGVTCWGSEPSSMGIYFFLLYPYLLGSIMFRKSHRMRYIIMIVLLTIIIAGSGSSSVQILFLMNLGCLVLYLHRIGITRYVVYGAAILGFLMALVYAIDLKVGSDLDKNSPEYIIYGKIIDKSNQSVMMRSSTLAVDMKEFARFPITGVGNGFQGLWYNELTPKWTRNSSEVDLVIRKGIINGGGNFFPAYLAAFGIIGIIAMLCFINKYYGFYCKSYIRNDKLWDFIYMSGVVALILSMWYTTSLKLNETACLLIVLGLLPQRHRYLN